MKYTERQIRTMILDWLSTSDKLDGFTETELEEIDADNQGMSEACRYALIEDYSPWVTGARAGDLLLVVWGKAEIIDLFYIKNDQLERVDQQRRHEGPWGGAVAI